MANLIKRKQLDWVQSAPILIQNFATTATDSSNVTSAITSALNSAGRGNSSVPLQVSTDEETLGVIASGDFARVEVWLTDSQDKIAGDNLGNEVYGRLSEGSGTYVLSYFYLNDSGAEVAYQFDSATNINFSFNYRYTAAKLPADAHIGLLALQISQDPGGNRQKNKKERLTVTAQNTLSNLSETIADLTQLTLVVNGVEYASGVNQPVTITGQTPGWNPAAFGTERAWNLETSDEVYANYNVNA